MDTVTIERASANVHLASLASSVWSLALVERLGESAWGNVVVGIVVIATMSRGSADVQGVGWVRIVPSHVHLENLVQTVSITATAIMVECTNIINA